MQGVGDGSDARNGQDRAEQVLNQGVAHEGVQVLNGQGNARKMGVGACTGVGRVAVKCWCT